MTKKQQILALLMTLSLGACLNLPAQGFAGGNDHPRWAEHERGQEKGRGHHLDRMAEELGLSVEQKAQVQAIFEMERTAAAPLRQELRANREKIQAASRTEPFDENAVRSLAESQAATQTELIVSRARTQSQVNAILTPEQRARSEQMLAERRRNHGPGGHHGISMEDQP